MKWCYNQYRYLLLSLPVRGVRPRRSLGLVSFAFLARSALLEELSWATAHREE